VRVDGRARSEERTRTGTTSAIISSSERRALTESLSTSSVAMTEVDRGRQRRGIPTAALVALTFVLLAAAAALWATLLR
jgi:hypothetical protein